MTETALQTEIDAFDRNVGYYRNTWGPSWVVVVGAEAKGHFSEFDAAARFAIDTYPETDFLIRHTDPEPEFLPLIAVWRCRRAAGPRAEKLTMNLTNPIFLAQVSALPDASSGPVREVRGSRRAVGVSLCAPHRGWSKTVFCPREAGEVPPKAG